MMPMNKKFFVAAMVTFVLLLSLVGIQLAEEAMAIPNPSVTLSTTQQPTIKILSPLNDSFFNVT
jgi:hypothetical protein